MTAQDLEAFVKQVNSDLFILPRSPEPHAVSEFRREVLRRSLDVLGYPDIPAFLCATQEQIAIVTFLAGAGTRWTDSLTAAGITDKIDPSLPRCTHPIADIDQPGSKIRIGSYNLRAARGLGKQYVVWGTHREQIKLVAKDAGVETVYVKQEIPAGAKGPLGHGDGLFQVLDHFDQKVRIVITNFGGDPNCGETMLAAAAYFMALLKEQVVAPQAVLPVTLKDKPAYSISCDQSGNPISFGQPRLKGTSSSAGKGWDNVGVRLYAAQALPQAVQAFRQFYDQSAAAYSVPGNSESTFGLDNLDEYFAGLCDWSSVHRQKRLRLLGIACPFEIDSAIKSFQDISGFLESQRQIKEHSRLRMDLF